MTYALEVPPAGGNTPFKHVTRIRSTPEPVEARIANLKIQPTVPTTAAAIAARRTANASAEVTGRDAPDGLPPTPHRAALLYLGRPRNGVSGGTELADSEALLDELWDFVARPEFAWDESGSSADLVLG